MALREGENFLPYGIINVEKTDYAINLTEETFPWLNSNDLQSPSYLQLATFSNGKQAYIGSAVRGKLINLAEKANQSSGRQDLNRIFYKGILHFLENNNKGFDTLQYPNSDQSIYYIKHDALRIYFIRMQDIKFGDKNLPVLVKIGICQKNDQFNLLSSISTTNIRGR